MSKSKEVATVNPDAGALALAAELGIEFNPMASVQRPRLPRIKINRELCLFTIEGEKKPVETVSGHILAISNVKAWWEKTYTGGDSAMPDCYAVDSIYPQGDNVQCSSCTECKWNEYQSSRKAGSAGKDCSDKKRILFLMDGQNLPSILDIPPLGLRSVDDFLTRYAAKAGQPPLPVANLEIGLEAAKSRGGQDGTKPVITVTGFPTTREEVERVAAAMKTFASQFKEEAVHDGPSKAGPVESTVEVVQEQEREPGMDDEDDAPF